ncbi:rhodanese-like domain-containing protein [Bacillus sp. RO2]|uniref:rhodanese-like domain-containing protein n=1 Tax=Bacillus sp. RO2 TaxID=2723913 RepID=UPI00145C7DDA|nr:rhodanese-like domain-containing protein [Bacillus sp. RO2]NMH75348.1 rhodanese-like domain-containing protein [Bacillus sp. RO2]
MKEITPQELEAKLAAGEQISIIDVREAEEVAAGKIPQAVNIPLSLLEFSTQDIDKSKTHFMVCRSGGRSGKASMFLAAQGFDVINMVGGMLEWEGNVE